MSAADRILAAVQAIGPGQVRSYAQVAAAAGLPGRARQVARVLAGTGTGCLAVAAAGPAPGMMAADRFVELS